MMGWLIALAVLVFLGVLPLGVSVLYDSAGAAVRAMIGPVKVKVFPKKKKEKKPKAKKEKPKKNTPPQEQPQPGPAGEGTGKKKAPAPKEKKQGGPISDFIPLVYVVLDLLADFPRLFRIHRLDLNLILGGGDPADLGENYGKACAALGNLWPRLEETFIIRRRNVKLQCDFESSQTLIEARLDISVTLGRLLGFCFRHGFKALREFIKIINLRKGGAAI